MNKCKGLTKFYNQTSINKQNLFWPKKKLKRIQYLVWILFPFYFQNVMMNIVFSVREFHDLAYFFFYKGDLGIFIYLFILNSQLLYRLQPHQTHQLFISPCFTLSILLPVGDFAGGKISSQGGWWVNQGGVWLLEQEEKIMSKWLSNSCCKTGEARRFEHQWPLCCFQA